MSENLWERDYVSACNLRNSAQKIRELENGTN